VDSLRVEEAIMYRPRRGAPALPPPDTHEPTTTFGNNDHCWSEANASEETLVGRHQRFLHSLNAAIAQGSSPAENTGLGPMTLVAISRVAGEHPEATVEQIADACEAFHREHQ
jgi:hypothetical protein